MKINCIIYAQAETEIFVSVMNRISDGDIVFYDGFKYDGNYDYSICIDGHTHNLERPISILFEAVNHNASWKNLETFSRRFYKILNWNRVITTENSVYSPYLFWMIPWESDIFDDDLNLSFNREEKKHLLSFAGTNKNSLGIARSLYPDRIHIINSAIKRIGSDDFHIYGHGWNYGHYMQPYVQLKSDVMKKYKFSITFENMTDVAYGNGYVTEKIYDALRNYTVPIYNGAPNITNYVPKECFIDVRDFDFYDDVIEYICDMNIEEYESYLHSIDAYLKSPHYHELIHPSHLYETIKEIVL